MADEASLILSFVTSIGNLGLKLYEALRPKKRDPPLQERNAVYNVCVSISINIHNSPHANINIRGPRGPTS